MRKPFCLLFIIICWFTVSAQNTASSNAANSNELKRPKLVVGLVVDQMRWDYLYRYYHLYQPDGGFKRLLSQGFSCDNTSVPYIPSFTACGHASIYTGSVPAIDGITGNDWWDYDLSKEMYCSEDDSVKTIGSATQAGQMSPRNLLVTTIGDELHLADNFHSKVIGIALKDRSAIFPAGHSANAAYWYDEKTGDWITSSYYMNDLPQWVKELNQKKLVNNYYQQNWNTLYPIDQYVQSAGDVEPYEYRPFGKTGFPYNLQQFVDKNYEILAVTPYGNSFTFDMARAAINGEHLGKDSSTDLLAISLSTPDYIGHTFGPNSVEAEDDFLRLDKDIGAFLDYLDQQIGKGQYLLFLTADHGVVQVPAFLKEHKIPAGNVDDEKITSQLNALLKNKFNADKLVIGIINNQVFLDRNVMAAARRLNKEEIYNAVINFLMQQPGIFRAFALDQLDEVTLNKSIKDKIANGYYPSRSGDIQILYKPQWIDGFQLAGTTHGAWNPYDSHIPLIWYGWNIAPGKTNREVYMTDIAPTIAAMLHIQMPSGAVGHVIEEVSK
jgi:predicted AlkP superfamily pyrophosphatase or phosphodiesterase